MPQVIKFSQFENIKKKYADIYIVIRKDILGDTVVELKQNQLPLKVLRTLGSINPNETPCYILTQMRFADSTAYVQMVFDYSGLIVYGNLNHVDGQWKPDAEFRVALR